jgi:asparagine synthase (glutamine-hydrolysing)
MSVIGAIWKNADDSGVGPLIRSVLSSLGGHDDCRQASWNDSRIALGGSFTGRLPEDRFDVQPLWNEDRSVCLVADIRLDNRNDLARELGLIHPEELADSAFLMAAWLRWGPACLDHIIGGFAFAIWIPGRQELFAARDHAGERPLFYHRGKHLFALASMPKGLLVLPEVSRGFQESYIIDWLANLKPDSAGTFFAGIERLPPGHFLRVTPHTFECRQYWHPSDAKPTRYKRDEEYAEALLEIFDRATEARLRSTKPIGSFLSAGFDSSSVTASAARLLAAQGKDLIAFTSVPRPGFSGVAGPGHLPNEGEIAAEIAQLYPNIQHHIVNSLGYDLLGTMKTWTHAMDEPSVNLVNLLWISAIFDQARQRGIGVMLEGSIGNATISWNSRSILSDYFLRGRWVKLARTAHGLRSHGALSFKTAVRFATCGLVPGWFTRMFIPANTLDGLYACLVNPQLMDSLHLKSKIFNTVYSMATHPRQEHREVYAYGDLGKVNAAVSAATQNQIEMRDPTADKRIYDFCFSIPEEQYVVGGHSRSLVRRAMKDRLPNSVLNSYVRGLQGADWYLSVTESLPEMRRELALIKQSPAAQRALDLPGMQTLLDNWPQSGFHIDTIYSRWHSALTRAISMGHFLRSHESPLI